MTSYVFKVVVEPDEDRWYAYCPALVDRGAVTRDATGEKALAKIEHIVKIVVAAMMEQRGGNCQGPSRATEPLRMAADYRRFKLNDCIRCIHKLLPKRQSDRSPSS